MSAAYLRGPASVEVQKDYQAGCTGKIRFASPALAISHAARGFGQSGSTFESYQCRHCHGWHFTQQRLAPKSIGRRQ